MLRFILQKLGMAIPTLLLISVMVFALIRLIPGDPALLMLGDMADPRAWPTCAATWAWITAW